MTITPNSATTEGSSIKARTAPLPSAMPRKANPIHQQILGELLKPRTTTRTETRAKNVRRGKDGVYRHDLVKVSVPVPTLAGNVSEHTLNRMAKRWAA